VTALFCVIGTFVVCWLPFFVLATVRPFCGEPCRQAIPPPVVSLIGWLGYVNSLLNPCIYTVFNPDFRRAFRRILRLDSARTDAAPSAGNRGAAAGSGHAAAARSRGGIDRSERSHCESRPATNQPVRSSAVDQSAASAPSQFLNT